jgi:hypothetical protein
VQQSVRRQLLRVFVRRILLPADALQVMAQSQRNSKEGAPHNQCALLESATLRLLTEQSLHR